MATMPTLQSLRDDIRDLSVFKLQEEFSQLYDRLFDNIGRLAVRLVAIEAAGEVVRINVPTSQISWHNRFLVFLRKIGTGKIALEAAPLAFSDPVTFAQICALPPQEQAEVAKLPMNEIAKRFGANRKTGSSRRGTHATGDLPNLIHLARESSPRDAAEMAITIIKFSQNPKAVADLVAARLEEIKQSAQPKPAKQKTKRVAVTV